MKKSIFTLTLLIFVCLSLPIISSAEFIPGEAWNKMDAETKYFFLAGVSQGQKRLIEELEIKDTDKLRDYLPMTDVETVMKIIDDLYKAPENYYISWEYLIDPARRKLRGAPSKEVDLLLEMLRAYFDYRRNL